MTAMAHDLRRSSNIGRDDAARWAAVERRDASGDGEFVYGVTSTGVYCRPSCPSRRPSRANARFFDTPEAAESEGFRACLRCRPRDENAVSVTNAGVEAARAYLDANADRSVSLAELAKHSMLSASHLQRSFKRIIGVSP